MRRLMAENGMLAIRSILTMTKRFSGYITLVLAVASMQVSNAQSDLSNGKDVGPIDVVASQSVFRPGVAEYRKAHMIGKNGLTVDADVIDIKLATKSAQMTGNIKAHIKRDAESQDITVNADKASFDRVKNEIVLTGNVKVVIYSPYTNGPMVQTGDSAIVQLGAAPEYPLITMDHVHSTFTPAQ
jgi:lipopolysaccharide export system protein LptA